jgi:hypothetical protein
LFAHFTGDGCYNGLHVVVDAFKASVPLDQVLDIPQPTDESVPIGGGSRGAEVSRKRHRTVPDKNAVAKVTYAQGIEAMNAIDTVIGHCYVFAAH